MQKPDDETPYSPTLFRSRSESASCNHDQKSKCGLIMLHRHDLIQVKIAKRQCESLGYKPLILNRPECSDNEKATQSIQRLDTLLLSHENIEITFVLVEANYSHIGADAPNFALLKYLLETLKPQFLFITTANELCLEKIKQNTDLEPAIVSDPSYATIKKIVPSLKPKISKIVEPVSPYQDYDDGEQDSVTQGF